MLSKLIAACVTATLLLAAPAMAESKPAPKAAKTAKTKTYDEDTFIRTFSNKTKKQVTDLVAFLNALTGELPAAYIQAPKLPPSGPNTPKPDPS